jgi:two-component system, OmpR family, sensor kinase
VSPGRWYKSLYWRIAFGFVAFLAAMLVVQGVMFTWAVSYSGRTLPGQSPARLGQTVALDLANAIEQNGQLDLAKYVHDQYLQYTHPFFVMMSDGRFITSGSKTFPEPLIRIAKARLERPDRLPRGDRPFDRPGRAERPAGDRPRFAVPPVVDFRDGLPTVYRLVRPAPIMVHGELAGVVVVPAQAPFGFLLGRFAPILGAVAAGVLLVGTVLATVLVFGPARRRLRALETAAHRLGAGDLAARAPDRGGDEIAAVAHAFNAMADDLSARAKALAESDRVRRQLLADVSHELTTPVTAMRGYLETLTMPELSLDDATRVRYLTIIGDETARLERIIGDLLDLARLEGGGGALKMESIEVAQLFDRVAARHGPALDAAGVQVETAIERGAERVVGDRDRLEQALQNLGANAIRYAPAGSTVKLAARPAASGVTITVTDQGAGIEPEHLPHIFDRFYKADASRTGVAGGSGLGLSIVRTIVERHGGRISVTSRPGQTVFEIAGLASPAPGEDQVQRDARTSVP